MVLKLTQLQRLKSLREQLNMVVRVQVLLRMLGG